MQLSSLFSPPRESFSVCGAASLYLWCFSREAGRVGDPSPAGESLDGRHCWSCPELGMLNGGREGLFELGQQLQQQGEYQAALHCFLSCLLGLTHVQSFTSLPNCLHQVSPMTHVAERPAHTAPLTRSFTTRIRQICCMMCSFGPQHTAHSALT